MSRILIVDDEESICWSFREFLEEDGHRVETAASAEAALESVASRAFDVVVMDVRLPGMDGLSALPRIRESSGAIPIVVITAFGDLETAVRAMAEGAFEYLVKPFDLDRASAVLRRAIDASGAQRDAPAEASPATREETLVGSSPAMQELFRAIAMAAPSDVPVLITGESGTGKELVARALHRFGPRKSGPFVAVGLPSLGASSVEGELFGLAEGKFAGAVSGRKGIFEAADGGTVLLDEIGDAPASLQVKLLRAIENNEILPVGEGRPRSVDTRVIAATHRPLLDLVAAGSFRQDLYFRLAAFPIRVPPLRDRLEDIPALARHFLAKCRPGGDAAIGPGVLDALAARAWPGHVRELRNAIEHAAIIARGGAIREEHLPAPHSSTVPGAMSLPDAVASWSEDQASRTSGDLHERFLHEAEPPLLRAALKTCAGNRAAAAQLLGIDRATLRIKLRRYGIE